MPSSVIAPVPVLEAGDSDPDLGDHELVVADRGLGELLDDPGLEVAKLLTEVSSQRVYVTVKHVDRVLV